MRTIIDLPDTDRERLDSLCRQRGLSRAEGLRQALRSAPVRLPAAPTISCGVTTYRPGETDQELLLRADQALYRA